MFKGMESVHIGSSDAKKLAAFYREVVGLKQTLEFEMGDDNQAGFEFDLGGGCMMYIMDHSEVKGKNKEPGRFMVNIEVDNIESEFDRLKKAKVKVVAPVYHIEDYGYVATFEDADGNYFQLVKTQE